MRPTLLILIACLSAACTVGPNYKRPAIATPQSFRAPDPLPAAQADSIADLKWFEVFKDEQLQALMRHALERNYDLRDAVARVEQARAALGITRADQFPNFGAGASVEINRLSRDGATPLSAQFLPSQNRISEPPRCSCCPSK
jgi:outer membrane protein, multidrug efflux system